MAYTKRGCRKRLSEAQAQVSATIWGEALFSYTKGFTLRGVAMQLHCINQQAGAVCS